MVQSSVSVTFPASFTNLKTSLGRGLAPTERYAGGSFFFLGGGDPCGVFWEGSGMFVDVFFIFVNRFGV